MSRDRTFLFVLLAAATVLHLLLAWRLELGQDEAYTYAVTGPFQLSFFDHPPLSFWLSTLMQALFGQDLPAFALRLPFVLIATGSIWAMYQLTANAYGSRAGLWAAALFAAAPFFFASAGGWVMPDGPLMLFLLLGALRLQPVLYGGPGPHWRDWLLAGLFVGLAMLSKYQAVLTLLGAFVLLLTPVHRRWLASPQPYVAALIALAAFAPAIIWNAQNEWSSFAFQLGRGANATGLRPLGWLLLVARQAVYVLPWTGVALVAAAVVARRRRVPQAGLFLALALPAIILFNLQPLFGPGGQAHWSMAGWLFLFPLVGWWITDVARTGLRTAFGIVSAAVIAILSVGTLLYADAFRLFAGIRGVEVFAAETMPWDGVRTGLQESGLLDRPNTFLAAMNWRDTAKFAEAMKMPVVALGDDPRGFAYLTSPTDHIGQDAILAVLPWEVDRMTALLGPSFSSLELMSSYPTFRDGVQAFTVVVMIGRNLQYPVPRRYGLR